MASNESGALGAAVGNFSLLSPHRHRGPSRHPAHCRCLVYCRCLFGNGVTSCGRASARAPQRASQPTARLVLLAQRRAMGRCVWHSYHTHGYATRSLASSSHGRAANTSPTPSFSVNTYSDRACRVCIIVFTLRRCTLWPLRDVVARRLYISSSSSHWSSRDPSRWGQLGTLRAGANSGPFALGPTRVLTLREGSARHQLEPLSPVLTGGVA
jgi:hypothetical protein